MLFLDVAKIQTLIVHGTTDIRRYFEYECVRYVYDTATGQFSHSRENSLDGMVFSSINDMPGLSHVEAAERKLIIGPYNLFVLIPRNNILFPADTYLSGIVREFTGYFYVYQLMALWIWFYYAASISSLQRSVLLYGTCAEYCHYNFGIGQGWCSFAGSKTCTSYGCIHWLGLGISVLSLDSCGH